MPAIERLAWTAAAWHDYLHWQSQDPRQLRRINQLIKGKRSGGWGSSWPSSPLTAP